MIRGVALWTGRFSFRLLVVWKGDILQVLSISSRILVVRAGLLPL